MIEVLLKRKTGDVLSQIWEFYSDLLVDKLIDRLEGRNDALQTIEVSCREKEEEEDKLLSVQDVCQIFGVTRGTLNNWRKLGYFKPDTKVGRSPRYKMSSVQSFINSKNESYDRFN